MNTCLKMLGTCMEKADSCSCPGAGVREGASPKSVRPNLCSRPSVIGHNLSHHVKQILDLQLPLDRTAYLIHAVPNSAIIFVLFHSCPGFLSHTCQISWFSLYGNSWLIFFTQKSCFKTEKSDPAYIDNLIFFIRNFIHRPDLGLLLFFVATKLEE